MIATRDGADRPQRRENDIRRTKPAAQGRHRPQGTGRDQARPADMAPRPGSVGHPSSVRAPAPVGEWARILEERSPSGRSRLPDEPSLNGLVRVVLIPIALRDHDRRTVSWLQLTSLRLATGRRASSSANTAAFASSRQSAPLIPWKGLSSAPLIRRRAPRASASGPARRRAACLSPDRRRSDAPEPADPPVADARAGPPQRSAAMRSVPQSPAQPLQDRQ